MTETPIICVWPQPPGGLKSTFPSDQKKETSSLTATTFSTQELR